MDAARSVTRVRRRISPCGAGRYQVQVACLAVCSCQKMVVDSRKRRKASQTRIRIRCEPRFAGELARYGVIDRRKTPARLASASTPWVIRLANEQRHDAAVLGRQRPARVTTTHAKTPGFGSDVSRTRVDPTQPSARVAQRSRASERGPPLPGKSAPALGISRAPTCRRTRWRPRGRAASRDAWPTRARRAEDAREATRRGSARGGRSRDPRGARSGGSRRAGERQQQSRTPRMGRGVQSTTRTRRARGTPPQPPGASRRWTSRPWSAQSSSSS